MTASVQNVNKREELERQLRELSELEFEEESEPLFNPKNKVAGSPRGLWDPLPEGWEPPPYVQPENDPRSDPSKFQVGNYYWRSSWHDSRLERMALPYPQWPRPGQIATKEERDGQSEQHTLWMRSSKALEDCIWRWGVKINNPHKWDEKWQANFDAEWRWLTGIWDDRGLPVPTEDQLTQWANKPQKYAEPADRYPYQIPPKETA